MCGIVAAVLRAGDVVPFLLDGLSRLEYRGYDSAGIAVVGEKGLRRERVAGRVAALATAVQRAGLSGRVGIAHTRWATHGAPTEANAHPHVAGGVALVHNGIVENAAELRAELTAKGVVFASETDSEVIVQALAAARGSAQSLRETMATVLPRLQGALAIAVIVAEDPTRFWLARRGSPLVIGIGEEGFFAASDPAALVPVTRRLIYLSEGDWAEVAADGVTIWDREGRRVERAVVVSSLTAAAVGLNGYRHFMQKEIFEQPQAVAQTIGSVGAGVPLSPALFGAAEGWLPQVERVRVLACGTSYHAGLVGRYWLEELAGVPTTVEVASEYRYRRSVVEPKTLVVAISQSGETADTLAAVSHAQALGEQWVLAICNVAESALTRLAGATFLTHAGPEIGVASTKAFTTQLVALALLALVLAKVRGRLPSEEERERVAELRHLPLAIQQALGLEEEMRGWALSLVPYRSALYLGRGADWPIALEGALKLKEVSYLHAEGYPAGELKHGPLALVDREMPVVAIAAEGALMDKVLSNLAEVQARGGALFVLADGGAAESVAATMKEMRVVSLPERAGFWSPAVRVVPLQLLAYHTALLKGTDVDKPRNLAKSVTVE
ncbi:MAG: glutamine--fructose-6-phosphate transaminase (isomerizing) [Hydrogenophilus sp.]|nr:glutamine--fructose-6-phosphate transaminase (isomerizing) [Hydrogenophilus sp.]